MGGGGDASLEDDALCCLEASIEAMYSEPASALATSVIPLACFLVIHTL